ncbi:hypothetical protein SAMN05192559_101633 [Halobacillus karajensis]|uniref:Uncharacterized protein n=1 Tax=Halobacillus karajensis TaxID=195088 RepID=A0A024P5C9_9BACI|nr:hypothetical protein BN982_01025 [Halobacillus karajensis]CDQ23182.1 hypothetical protein BN983_01403 [Halobacillus karajensis]CDQ26664.1 hypothetical protein BN981_00883 [Halobacillus karajensis]SEH47105.1 hypothetical protein SAMN05192559_101633 [Halobacillus karajensis]
MVNLKNKLNLIIGLHIASTLMSATFSIVMLVLTLRHDRKVTGE